MYLVISQYFSAALLPLRFDRAEGWNTESIDWFIEGQGFSRSYNLVPYQEKPIHHWVPVLEKLEHRNAFFSFMFPAQ